MNELSCSTTLSDVATRADAKHVATLATAEVIAALSAVVVPSPTRGAVVYQNVLKVLQALLGAGAAGTQAIMQGMNLFLVCQLAAHPSSDVALGLLNVCVLLLVIVADELTCTRDV